MTDQKHCVVCDAIESLKPVMTETKPPKDPVDETIEVSFAAGISIALMHLRMSKPIPSCPYHVKSLNIAFQEAGFKALAVITDAPSSSAEKPS